VYFKKQSKDGAFLFFYVKTLFPVILNANILIGAGNMGHHQDLGGI